jgi:hypothetical protein
MAFGTPGVQPDSTYRIAPTNNRLQKNMYSTGYSEFMDYMLLMLSRILDMVVLQGCMLEEQGIKMSILIS